MDMQGKLQAALMPGQGGATTTQTMPQQEAPMMGDQGMEERWQQVVEQLQAVMEAMETTQDPQELRQLAQAAEGLQAILEEEYGGQLPPGMGGEQVGMGY